MVAASSRRRRGSWPPVSELNLYDCQEEEDDKEDERLPKVEEEDGEDDEEDDEVFKQSPAWKQQHQQCSR